MYFYTHVARIGNKIFLRGYEKGKRIQCQVDYRPYIFVSSQVSSEFRTLNGKSVSKFFPGSMRDTSEYIKSNSDVAGHEIYGIESYEYQFINDTFSGEVLYDPNLISVVTVDIETDSEGGFPDIKTANKAIVSITLRKKDNVIAIGTKPYTPELEYVQYIQCRDERDLLNRFIEIWSSTEWLPDVLTGWNVEFFDMPYLINRIERLFDERTAKRLSPWGLWETRRNPNGTEGEEIRIPLGVTVLDYMQLYKKFTFSQQESFKLDHIAFLELGEKKIDYAALGYDTLHDFYKNDYQNFINYNIRDVDLVYRIDQKMKLLEQVYAIAYDGKVNLIDSLTTVGMWDIIIHNYLIDKKIVIPLKKKGDKPRQIEGAYVKDPQVGLHKWVVSFDLNSLYPHLIMQYNISPETLIGQLFEFDLAVTTKSVDQFLDGIIDRERTQDEVVSISENIKMCFQGVDTTHDQQDSIELCNKLIQKHLSIKEILTTYNSTITPTGCLFRKDKKGFLPTLMETMYNDRTVWKKRMLDAKKRYEEEKTKELENEVARCHNMQLAKKIQLNSAYGALSNQFFRWFDNRLAESITKSGQLSIRWMERKINEYLNKVIKTDNVDYVIAIDTDSMYITLDKLVEKVFNNQDVETSDIVNFLDRTCQQVFEPYIDRCYEELANYVMAYEQKMKMKREAIANKGIWTGKKHYILNVFDLEGVRYSEPKLKMQGIEAVRSSTPSSCREKIKQALSVIMNRTETDLHKFIKAFHNEFKTLPFEEIAFPRSVRGLITKDVVGPNGVIIQKAYDTGTLNFLKSTPIHVKGSLMYNYLLKLRKLENKYQKINEGEKIKFCYVLDSSPIPTNVIATPGKLPKEIGLDKYLDRETQFQKAFIEPINTILTVIGWSTGNDQQTLDNFFG